MAAFPVGLFLLLFSFGRLFHAAPHPWHGCFKLLPILALAVYRDFCVNVVNRPRFWLVGFQFSAWLVYTRDLPIFYFKPYPGSTITNDVVNNGYALPSSTEEWGDFDYIASAGPWVSREKESFFEAFKFYLKLGYGRKRGVLFYQHRKISQWRCKNDQYKLTIEKFIIEKIRPKQHLS